MESIDFEASSHSNNMGRWARRVERACCTFATYLPLLFVYGLTTWAVWVDVSIGSNASKVSWLGMLTLVTDRTPY